MNDFNSNLLLIGVGGGGCRFASAAATRFGPGIQAIGFDTDADLLTKLGAGIVFTGGGAAMPGLCELGQSIFGVPCAIGEPSVFSPALDNVPNLPAYATAVGLIQYGIRTYHDTGVKDFIRRIFGR